MTRDPIAADTPIESGPLVLYNWADYIHKKVVAEFEEEYGVEVDITTYNNMEEGIQKVANDQVTAECSCRRQGTCAVSWTRTSCCRCNTS